MMLMLTIQEKITVIDQNNMKAYSLLRCVAAMICRSHLRSTFRQCEIRYIIAVPRRFVSLPFQIRKLCWKIW